MQLGDASKNLNTLRDPTWPPIFLDVSQGHNPESYVYPRRFWVTLSARAWNKRLIASNLAQPCAIQLNPVMLHKSAQAEIRLE